MICFIGFHLGNESLILSGTIEISFFAQYIIFTSLFWIQVTLIAGYSLELYNKKLLIQLLPFYAIDFVIGLIMCNLLNTFIWPSLYILFISIFNKINIKQCAIKMAKIWGFIALFQAITSIYKLGLFQFEYASINTYQTLMLGIDLTIFIGVIYCLGGEKYYERFCSFLSAPSQITQNDNEDDLAWAEFKKLVGFKRAKAILLLLSIQIIQWLIILFCCKLGDRLIEGLAITISFIGFGFIIQKKWHSDSILMCTFISSVTFYCASKLIPAYGYTQLFPVLTGMFMVVGSYLVAVNSDKKCLKRMDDKIEEKYRLASEAIEQKILGADCGVNSINNGNIR